MDSPPLPSYGEISTAVIMSTGVGLASILSGFVKGGANFESFLFGTIVAITDFEFYMILVVSAAVVLFLLLNYKNSSTCPSTASPPAWPASAAIG